MSSTTHPAGDPTLERWLHALAGIGEAVGGDEPVAQLLDRVARTACTLLGYDFCAVFLPDDARAALTIVGSHGLSGDYIAQVNADRPILLDVDGEQEAPTSIAFRTGEVVILEDIELVPEFGWGGVAHEQGYRALISVPLRRAGAVIGALNGYRTGPHSFDAAEVSLVTTLATQVAIALGTAQLRAQEQATIRELRRAEEVHGLLMATALRGEGVAGVADALAELLGRAVLIDEVHGGELTPTVIPVDDHWESGVVLGGTVVARIQVAGEHALSALDVRAVEHAAVVTALELLRARTAAEVEQRLRGSLLADLLTADVADAQATGSLLERARRLGWDLSGSQTLITIRWPEAERAERILAITDRFAADFTPRPLAALYRGDLVLVCSWESHSKAVDLAGKLAGTLSASGAAEFAVAAVSATGTVTDLPDAYRTLCGAMNLASDTQSTTVIDMADVTIGHLLLQLDDPQRLRAFARAVLGPVLDYDRSRQTELIHTARVHLEHSLDRRATANALHLHPNTVAQRIRRLEELTGLQLSRPRDLLRLTSALTVAQVAALG
ncbi:helix-turn-helix domain-containing protein [Mycolicibacterium frederiksbergense]|uniref:helix-turn-helix domain-containing protein n=1 Tax=Mycolicibacterium frederiksbergense TaxID=117567 RepID=UPI00265BAC36|nr:GAF domain-containing protein [Mycolicibacterium frederiksbergense]MBX9920303.1 GAF domain-containing protein [Mycolicibacterium frederiksbergense]MDO0974067.1 GAF domain-containing protein [Mycolicibacterium frederiksbergense]